MSDNRNLNYPFIIIILLITIIIPKIQKYKFNQMFSLTDTNKDLSSIGSVLLIIAHPDDEIMFWTPTISYFLSNKINLKILCLSNGNYNGLGEKREIEFDNVSRELNLSENVILNIPELQDNITIKWDKKKVAEVIDDFLRKNNDVKTILTFDKNGVTKHPNHISCYEGLIYYLKENYDELIKNNIQIYTLDSFNFIFQYTWVVPMIKNFVSKYSFNSYTFFKSYKLMRLYETQFNLLRKAHTIFSSYSYFNSYTKISISDIQK